MIVAVVFDLDNTLVDFMQMKRNAVQAGIRSMIDAGLQRGFDEIDTIISRVYEEQGIEYQRVFNQVLEQLTGEVDHKILAAGIVGYRKAREANLVPYAHVHMTLFTLARMGLKLGVLSDAPKLEAWLRLCSLNLHHIFDAVVTFEDTGVRKPDPLPFNRVLSLMNVKAENAIMVGDWEQRDIFGARNIGMITAFARYGDTFNTGTTSADYDLQDICELIDIVRGINGAER
jgi:HAD superfamily hydrolase (TIGR02253 family)